MISDLRPLTRRKSHPRLQLGLRFEELILKREPSLAHLSSLPTVKPNRSCATRQIQHLRLDTSRLRCTQNAFPSATVTHAGRTIICSRSVMRQKSWRIDLQAVHNRSFGSLKRRRTSPLQKLASRPDRSHQATSWNTC